MVLPEKHNLYALDSQWAKYGSAVGQKVEEKKNY